MGVASDVYALGIIFVEMLSGKLPFSGGTLLEILSQRIIGHHKSLKDLGVEVDPALGAVVDRCLVKRCERPVCLGRRTARRSRGPLASRETASARGATTIGTADRFASWPVLLILALGVVAVVRLLPSTGEETASTEAPVAAVSVKPPLFSGHLALQCRGRR